MLTRVARRCLVLLFALSLLTTVASVLSQATVEKWWQTISLVNLKRIGAALPLYAKEHGGRLPDLRDATRLEAALAPYVGDRTVFREPVTARPYRLNAALSGRVRDGIAAPDAVILAHDPVGAYKNGYRNVLFVDGHAKSLSRDRFETARVASALKALPPADLAFSRRDMEWAVLRQEIKTSLEVLPVVWAALSLSAAVLLTEGLVRVRRLARRPPEK